MKIKKLELKNGYKRFHHLTIDLGEKPARIVALVGANGCGKSSVLDGMLFLNNAYGAIGNRGAKDYTYHSMHGVAGYNYHSVSIGLRAKTSCPRAGGARLSEKLTRYSPSGAAIATTQTLK